MKSIVDREMLRKRASLAHTASLGGLIILLVAVAFPLIMPKSTTVSAAILFVGFSVSAIGVFMANRWVKKPRPEDALDKSLKSLSDQYRLYHYLPAADHLLLTPMGIVAIETVNLDGTFTYVQGRWKQSFSMNRALRYLFEERLGNPILRAQKSAEAYATKLASALNDDLPVNAQALVVFIHPLAEVDAKGTPIPVCTPKSLSKKIPVNLPRLELERYHQIQAILDESSHPGN
ncbi:MAG: NERD domain-containing protein [Chloroflexi bacterium]|nr:NERD domain-containing protein [Chloroflexota bacterium]